MPTVAEFIEHLKTLPADAPVVLRSWNGNLYLYESDAIDVIASDLVHFEGHNWADYESEVESLDGADPEDAEMLAGIEESRVTAVVISSDWIDDNPRLSVMGF